MYQLIWFNMYLNYVFVLDRQYRKRRRVSENQEIEDRLESLILRVGEKVIYHIL